MSIPVRVPADATLHTVGTPRYIGHDHPLADKDCPACDDLLIQAAIVLVYIGIPPQNRRPTGSMSGSAVAVHAACAGVDPTVPEEG